MGPRRRRLVQQQQQCWRRMLMLQVQVVIVVVVVLWSAAAAAAASTASSSTSNNGLIVTLTYNGNFLVSPPPTKPQKQNSNSNHWAQKPAVETLHVQCHLPKEEEHTKDIRGVCCQAMRVAAKRAAKSKRSKDVFMTLFRRARLEQEEQRCLQRGAQIAEMDTYNRMDDDDDDDDDEYPPTVPVFSYTSYGSLVRAGTLGPDLGTYAWNTKREDGMWLHDYTPGSVPFVESLLLNKNSNKNRNAYLETSLSKEGGMHRLLHHTLTIPLPKKSLGNVNVNVNASMLFWIPRDVFIDTEDAFDTHSFKARRGNQEIQITDNQKQKLSLSLQTAGVIDIEQPTFESPEHVVMIHLQGKQLDLACNENGKDDDNNDSSKEQAQSKIMNHPLIFEFATKLHLRYPTPVTTTTQEETSNSNSIIVPTLPNTNETLHVPVLVFPPLLIYGTLSTTDKTMTNNESKTVISFVQGNEHPLSSFLIRPPPQSSLSSSIKKQQQKPAKALSLWVATANTQDFQWVAISTVLMSVMGAVLLLYQMITSLEL